MRILVISPYPDRIIPAFQAGDYVEYRAVFDLDVKEQGMKFDWIISYGCREIIRPAWVVAYKGRIVNIHIGLLPWGRGADPNFWSWFDDTPKGIAIHEIDDGIDTGPIYGKTEVNLDPKEHTLETSYEALHKVAGLTFCFLWPLIWRGKIKPEQQAAGGSYHKTSERKAMFDRYQLNYRSPVELIVKLGEQHRLISGNK